MLSTLVDSTIINANIDHIAILIIMSVIIYDDDKDNVAEDDVDDGCGGYDAQ